MIPGSDEEEMSKPTSQLCSESDAIMHRSDMRLKHLEQATQQYLTMSDAKLNQLYHGTTVDVGTAYKVGEGSLDGFSRILDNLKSCVSRMDESLHRYGK